MYCPLALLVVFPLWYPHLLECVERCENRTTHPGWIQSFLRSCNLWRENVEFKMKWIPWSTKRSTLIFISFATCFLISANNRSPKPLNKVEPPERTIFWNSILRKSISDFCIAYVSTSCIPSHSSPMRSGRNRTSGARNLAGPIW